MIDHKDILEQFHDDWSADRNNREDMLDDLKFLAGDQWDSAARSSREASNRPAFTINRLGQFVRQVTGDMRLNPVSINVVPVDDGSDIETAEILEGIIRQIESQSNASSAYAHAFDCSAGVGLGHFRINTQYVPDTVDDQEIRIERMFNPAAVVWDASAVAITRADAMHCFVSDMMTVRAFKKEYPKADLSGFQREIDSSDLYWQQGDMIRVCEMWVKETYKRTLALSQDGSTLDVTGLSKSELSYLPLATDQDGKPRMRTYDDYKVKQALVSGSEMLTDWNDWAGRHIPIIPAIGTEIPLDEQNVRHGILRWAKDPQRLYNYYRSSQGEVIGQQPHSPFAVTAKMIEGFEAQWNTANTTPRPYLPFNHDPDVPSGPQRMAPPQASSAMWQEAAICADDMKATTGIHDASLGAKSNETSGKAIMARQREGDVGSYQYFDNFKTAMGHAGEVLIDLIPKIYDTQRIVRIIGVEDNEPKYQQINVQTVEGVMNDISVGRYDVRIKAGPSFSTKREEAREGMLMATQANPQLWQVAGDLIVKAMDWPHADEIAERIKRTIPPQITEEQGEGEQQQQQQHPPQVDPIQEAMARLAVEQSQAKVEKTHAETAKILVDAEQSQVDTALGGSPHL